jgi:Domain of unknown function (DUF5615)
MAGAVDPDVAQACQKEARALVTLDLDFSDIRAYPPEDYQGILVFRPVLHSITTLVRLTTRIIPLLNQEPLIGHLWIVEDQSGPDPGREPRRDSCEMTSGNEKAPSPATHGTGQSKQC